MDKGLWSIKEAAGYIGVCRQTMRKIIEMHFDEFGVKIPESSRVYVHKDKFLKWLENGGSL